MRLLRNLQSSLVVSRSLMCNINEWKAVGSSRKAKTQVPQLALLAYSTLAIATHRLFGVYLNLNSLLLQRFKCDLHGSGD